MSADLQSLITALPRPIPGRYADQIAAYRDGYETARADVLALLRAQPAANPAEAQKAEPSASEITVLAHQYPHTQDFARALLSRYGAQPAEQPAARGTLGDALMAVSACIVDYESEPKTEANSLILTGLRTAQAMLAQPAASAEPVAVVGANFDLFWAGSGPIAPLVERHGLKVGSHLFAAAIAAQQQPDHFRDVTKMVDHEPLHITHGPLMRYAAALLRLRKPVTPDFEQAASDLERAVDGHPTPSGDPSAEWLHVAELAAQQDAAEAEPVKLSSLRGIAPGATLMRDECDCGKDAADAARYRWLRDESQSIENIEACSPSVFDENDVPLSGPELDAAIDAAMRTTGREGDQS